MPAVPVSTSTLTSLFAYKAWANEELFAALASVDSSLYLPQLHSAIRILNHIYVVDRIFRAHLEGGKHGYAATNTKDTPSLADLTAAAKETDAWYVGYVARLSQSGLTEEVHFSFTDGDVGLMTREEILLHVITHGGYHRGAAGQIMRAAAVAPPRDLYTRFLHASQPERRE